MIRALIDLVLFAIWDRNRDLRPLPVKVAMRWETSVLARLFACPHCRETMRAIYYRNALVGMSPRAWRYLEKRRPDILFLWRFGAPEHPAMESA